MALQACTVQSGNTWAHLSDWNRLRTSSGLKVHSIKKHIDIRSNLIAWKLARNRLSCSNFWWFRTAIWHTIFLVQALYDFSVFIDSGMKRMGGHYPSTLNMLSTLRYDGTLLCHFARTYVWGSMKWHVFKRMIFFYNKNSKVFLVLGEEWKHQYFGMWIID